MKPYQAKAMAFRTAGFTSATLKVLQQKPAVQDDATALRGGS